VSVLLTIVFALMAATAFAFANVIQQRIARVANIKHTAADESATSAVPWLPVLAVLGRLMRDKWWMFGWLLNALGFTTHVLALHFGSITVVQATLLIQLVFALLLSAWRHGLRPTVRDWVGVAAILTGIATLVLLRGDVPQNRTTDGALLAYLAIVVVTIPSLIALGRMAHGRQLRSALVAVAAGVCFCTTAVLVTVLTDRIADYGAWGWVSWPLAATVVSCMTGTVLVQDSFTTGSMPTAVTTMTIVDPVASAIVGIILFDSVRPAGLEAWLGMPLAGALAVLGVILVASSPTLHDEGHLHTAPTAAEPHALPRPRASVTQSAATPATAED
jgi:drug/metabolite transporter (DMT)-like permease